MFTVVTSPDSPKANYWGAYASNLDGSEWCGI